MTYSCDWLSGPDTLVRMDDYRERLMRDPELETHDMLEDGPLYRGPSTRMRLMAAIVAASLFLGAAATVTLLVLS
ncbi:hypothetical protein IU501_25055 [Nocardia otitidiscaviarum]|uniref:hypothetical protein n=2 Tax=Nocardia otitidiscaviarum TaxID=1823 RepID=UPI0011DDAACD|nr:hypothetical protein [Nocardia otitidiscaviarum]MBF6136258.1 hypothetical protein [Nocardia otitidiscaviarum]MBF6484460.1 hypothetical protein [Nocardia otitidiscaviarum]